MVFYSTMILFRTILNRDIWFDPLGDVMGKWGLHNADGTLCTEPIENFMLFMPFAVLLLWAFKDEILGSDVRLGKVLWKSTVAVGIFSFGIEFSQLLFHLGTFQISDLVYNTLGGTVGGAVAMNAGAYGGEIKQVLTKVEYIEDGAVCSVEPEDSDLGYRFSRFAAPERIVLSAEFSLSPDDGMTKERMKDYSERRRAKQPLTYPSAGSTFKRPAGCYAGALIEQADLKGVSVGGAEVSTLHAGFIINKGGATSEDVKRLIKLVQERVYENSGVTLETEVKFIGR